MDWERRRGRWKGPPGVSNLWRVYSGLGNELKPGASSCVSHCDENKVGEDHFFSIKNGDESKHVFIFSSKIFFANRITPYLHLRKCEYIYENIFCKYPVSHEGYYPEEVWLVLFIAWLKPITSISNQPNQKVRRSQLIPEQHFAFHQ